MSTGKSVLNMSAATTTIEAGQAQPSSDSHSTTSTQARDATSATTYTNLPLVDLNTVVNDHDISDLELFHNAVLPVYRPVQHDHLEQNTLLHAALSPISSNHAGCLIFDNDYDYDSDDEDSDDDKFSHDNDADADLQPHEPSRSPRHPNLATSMKSLARFFLDVLAVSTIVVSMLVGLALCLLYLDISSETSSIPVPEKTLRDVIFVLSETFLVAIIAAVSWWE